MEVLVCSLFPDLTTDAELTDVGSTVTLLELDSSSARIELLTEVGVTAVGIGPKMNGMK